MKMINDQSFVRLCAELELLKQRAEAAEARVAELEAIKTPVCEWTPGVPPKMYAKEWFIARTKFGLAVLTTLPEGWSYDFTTADSTYVKAESITHWMQFPDSDYISPSQARLRELQAGDYEKLEAQNARLREALHDALSVMPEGRMREAVKAKLNGEEAST